MSPVQNFVRYWVLVEPSMGETLAKPGALFREEHTDTSYSIQVLIGPNEWVDRPSLFSYTVGDDYGAEIITATQAAKLEANFPWPGARTLRR